MSAQDPGTVSSNSGTKTSELRTTMGGERREGGKERKGGWEMLGADLIFSSSSLLPSHLGMQKPEGFGNDSLSVNQLNCMFSLLTLKLFLDTREERKQVYLNCYNEQAMDLNSQI